LSKTKKTPIRRSTKTASRKKKEEEEEEEELYEDEDDEDFAAPKTKKIKKDTSSLSKRTTVTKKVESSETSSDDDDKRLIKTPNESFLFKYDPNNVNKNSIKLIGSHVGMSKGFFSAVETTAQYGGTAFALFTRNQRTWKPSPPMYEPRILEC